MLLLPRSWHACAILLLACVLQSAPGQEALRAGSGWQVPFAGNAFSTRVEEGAKGKREADQVRRWSDPQAVLSLFFRVNGAAELELALRLRVPQGESRIRVRADGLDVEKELVGAETMEVPLGRIRTEVAGYVKLDLQGLAQSGPIFAEVESLRVTSVGAQEERLELNYVRDNEGNRFYWGRRGPSVHLGYAIPTKEAVEWFYSEVTVPVGSDPIGSYFMANGFGEGYFGMQVNGPEERRVLFSVWSPFTTDNPKAIPEDQRVVLLKKGEGVHGGEFGGEGSGGQSYWVYPWKAGTTYRFLNRATPDGQGSTVYSAWFYAPERGRWQLIASFRRPNTNKHLSRPHSFLENFADRQGHRERRAFYTNQWACDTKGVWHEVLEARFTGDDIAKRGYRLDFAGGLEKGGFFLRNGGFFNDTVALGGTFRRSPNPDGKPQVDLPALLKELETPAP